MGVGNGPPGAAVRLLPRGIGAEDRKAGLGKEVKLTWASEVPSQPECSAIVKYCSSQSVVYKIPRAFEKFF